MSSSKSSIQSQISDIEAKIAEYTSYINALSSASETGMKSVEHEYNKSTNSEEKTNTYSLSSNNNLYNSANSLIASNEKQVREYEQQRSQLQSKLTLLRQQLASIQ